MLEDGEVEEHRLEICMCEAHAWEEIMIFFEQLPIYFFFFFCLVSLEGVAYVKTVAPTQSSGSGQH